MKASERHTPDDLAFEDLEEEWDDDDGGDGGSGFLSWIALLVLAASTAGIGMGLSWLFSASNDTHVIAMPDWLQRDTPPSEPPVMVDVADLPQSSLPQSNVGSGLNPTPERSPLTPNNPQVRPPQANLRATRDFTDSPELTAPPLRETTPPEPQAVFAAAPVAESFEVVPPDDGGVIDLGENRGEGNFVVLVSYLNDASLAQARQVVTDAFVREMGGTTYIQVAAFSQIEYARHMADELQAQGLDVTITQ